MSVKIDLISTDPNNVPYRMAKLIEVQLRESKKVLWLISGGSSLPIAVEVMSLLPVDLLDKLTITMVDDIYGLEVVNKTNSEQLLTKGFKYGSAKFVPIIISGISSDILVKDFEKFLAKSLRENDFCIGQFGLGAGFHTGGIQPNSPAASEKSALAVGYDDNGVKRITVTPALIAKLDVAFINSFGSSKKELVEEFIVSDSGVLNQPTQALKLAKETILYTDCV